MVVAPGASTGYTETYYVDDGVPVPPHVYEAVSREDRHCKICGEPGFGGPHLAPPHKEEPPPEKYETSFDPGVKSGDVHIEVSGQELSDLAEGYGVKSMKDYEMPVPDETLTNDKPELDTPTVKPKGKKHK